MVHDLHVSDATLVEGPAQFFIDGLLLGQYEAGEHRNGGSIHGALHLARGSTSAGLADFGGSSKPVSRNPEGRGPGLLYTPSIIPAAISISKNWGTIS